MSHDEVRKTALKIVGLNDRGEVTLTGVENILGEFIARGIAAQKAADAIIAAEQSKPASD